MRKMSVISRKEDKWGDNCDLDNNSISGKVWRAINVLMMNNMNMHKTEDPSGL